MLLLFLLGLARAEGNDPPPIFSCEGKVIGGYYADIASNCSMFHVCTLGASLEEVQDIKFLCLMGTVFDQETRVCEREEEVDCDESERFYDLNLDLYEGNATAAMLNTNHKNKSTTPPTRSNPQESYYEDEESDFESEEEEEFHFKHVDVPRIPFARPNTLRIVVSNGEPFKPRLE